MSPELQPWGKAEVGLWYGTAVWVGLAAYVLTRALIGRLARTDRPEL